MRYLSDKEQQPRPRRDKWQHGRKHGRAVCPHCRQVIERGAWVKRAPGGLGTIRHAYPCGGGR